MLDYSINKLLLFSLSYDRVIINCSLPREDRERRSIKMVKYNSDNDLASLKLVKELESLSKDEDWVVRANVPI